MADKKWDKMSLDELEAAANELDEKRQAIANEARVLRRVIDSKLAAKSATDKLAKLSDAERMALHQMINDAGSIESLANVNGLSAE